MHAVRKSFCDDGTEAVLLVDARNAFNRLNRKVALNNIQFICPPLALTPIESLRTFSLMVK